MSVSSVGGSNRSQELADKNAERQAGTASGAADKIGQLGTGLASQATSAVGGMAGKGRGGATAPATSTTPASNAGSNTPIA